MNLPALLATIRLHLLPTNLARRWADEKLVDEADRMRRELIRAQARIDRQTQAMRRGERALYVATGDLEEATATIQELREELTAKTGQIERQADLFEEYRAEVDSARRERDDARQKLHEANIANRNLIRNNEALARLVNQALNALPKPPVALDEAWHDVAALGQQAGPR